MVEVHPDPEKALCDGAQSLDGTGFRQLMAELNTLRGILG
jgi:3-deoxy-7-phosphoheptulonate synthase